jgi:aryl-alcohol dehydrogenase-like predicted oxidoreductase
MMAEVVELPTAQVRSRESVEKCMQAMNERHAKGEIANVAQVYWLANGRVKLYITDGMTLANLAFAIKALDMELSQLIGPSGNDR